MANLNTNYLGMELKNPIVASASPLSKKLDNVKRMEDAGVSAVVMYSLFEEQIEQESLALDHYLNYGTESFAEAVTYFPEMQSYNIGPEKYLELIRKIKETVEIPVIGSLNGFTLGGWTEYARKIEQAGANALELNIYFIPSDPNKDSLQLENSYVELVSEVRKSIKIPLDIKLVPYVSSLPHFCGRLVEAGVNGLVIFNRFYQPDLDIENLEVIPNLQLSSSSELRLPLRWIAMLYGRVKADLALTTGVHTTTDVVKALMAGAQVTLITSEFLANGIQRASELVQGLGEWMETHEYQTVKQLIGSMSQKAVAEPSAFERANYMKILTSFDKNLRY
jgi:dihydroorotate dehydrogenase (fumarate)